VVLATQVFTRIVGMSANLLWVRAEYYPLGAVDYYARVWVNDQFVGDHQGGYTFSIDITPVWNETEPKDCSLGPGRSPRLNRVASRIGSLSLTVYGGIRAQPASGRPFGLSTFLLPISSVSGPRSSSAGRLALGPLSQVSTLMAAPKVKLTWQPGASERFYEVFNGEAHQQIAFSDPGIDDYRNELLCPGRYHPG